MMKVGDCYSMLHNGRRIRFRHMKYTSVNNFYYLRLCGQTEEIILNGLTTENANSLQLIDCVDCDGSPSATDQLKE